MQSGGLWGFKLALKSGKRILCVWGQGRGYGHAARLFSIADALGRDGHLIHLALRDVEAALPFSAGFRGTLSPCPVYRRAMRLKRNQASLADLLLLNGFGDKRILESLVSAWLSLISSISPEVIIVDHAHAALLAARQCGLPVYITGNPFVTPVPGLPLADWRPDASADNLPGQTEALVLRSINGLPGQSGNALGSVSDLFACKASVLTCFPVLDNFRGQRQNTHYCAASLTQQGEDAAGNRFDIVCYLKPGYAQLPALSEALATTGRTAVMLVPGLEKSKCRQLARGRVVAINRFSNLENLLTGARLFIGHGNMNSQNQCLRRAVPMLLLPMQMENLNHALQLKHTGLAYVSHAPGSSREYCTLIERTLGDVRLQHNLVSHAAQQHEVGEKSAGDVFRKLLAA
jgi:UDP:flavonoid glycosyltransferase YjiC (YdhE family)